MRTRSPRTPAGKPSVAVLGSIMLAGLAVFGASPQAYAQVRSQAPVETPASGPVLDDHTGGDLVYNGTTMWATGWTVGWSGEVAVELYLSNDGHLVQHLTGKGWGSASTSTASFCPSPGHWTLDVYGPQGTSDHKAVDV